MSKHRNKSGYRKITIAALVVTAVAVPSVAMAGYGPVGGKDGRAHAHRAAVAAQRVAAKKPATGAAARPAAGSTSAARVVELVNAERAKVGCSPVKVNAKLTSAAQAHSQDQASHKNMSHTGSDGSNPGDRITRAGYRWQTYGENVAYGYQTPESVMTGWMNSPGHKRNILNCAFKEIGVGLAQPGNYWTQNFAAGF
ncbi:CAP domain-containing protein [Streptomyces sp. LP05-1]|uniref:CAP domain-containing protein n=1 Tax=Streptomyces pyxinae TaxID=2970734 RepID=A0ABT2CL00_9ACTN|nr:CAP domain-containing protein [Streptomyces sp. LP05-1]MCS0638090.1 CAP domain-containing protein [Streptomyces sp. LP05-1]